jgi:hypothetical protein
MDEHFDRRDRRRYGDDDGASAGRRQASHAARAIPGKRLRCGVRGRPPRDGMARLALSELDPPRLSAA